MYQRIGHMRPLAKTSLACKRPVEHERGLKFNGPLLLAQRKTTS